MGGGGVIYHYDGLAWSSMMHDPIPLLNAVWGTGSANVYAVGEQGAILHYGGSVWRKLPIDRSAQYAAVWGSGPEDIYVAGTEAVIGPPGLPPTARPIVLHYDGQAWLTSVTPTYFTGLCGPDSNDLFATSFDGLFHFDGNSWLRVGAPLNVALFGIWGDDDGAVSVVGNSGAILHASNPAPNRESNFIPLTHR